MVAALEDMTVCFRAVALVAIFASSAAYGQDASPGNVPQGADSSTNTRLETKLPVGTILVKGAWSSASDSETPLTEGGKIANGVYTNPYFGFSYPLPADWLQKSTGPPPSASGRYVLTLLMPAATFKGPGRGTILITASDMFFTPLPIANALELINHLKTHLQADFKVELEPTETRIAGQSFAGFTYWSPGAQLYWHVLATEIRCHTVEFILMNRDPQTLESLVQEMNKINFAAFASNRVAAGDDAPVCIKDYASGENVVERVDPVFTQHRFSPVPVRILIDTEGKVRHIHFISAFPDQAKATTDALMRWKFKPYLRDGKPVEVETGIMFGRAPRLPKPQSEPLPERAHLQ